MADLKYLLAKYPKKDWNYGRLALNPGIDQKSKSRFDEQGLLTEYDKFIIKEKQKLNDNNNDDNDDTNMDTRPDEKSDWEYMKEILDQNHLYDDPSIGKVCRKAPIAWEMIKFNPEYFEKWSWPNLSMNMNISLTEISQILENKDEKHKFDYEAICARDDVDLKTLVMIIEKHRDWFDKCPRLTMICQFGSFEKIIYIYEHYPEYISKLDWYYICEDLKWEELLKLRTLPQAQIKWGCGLSKSIPWKNIKMTFDDPQSWPDFRWYMEDVLKNPIFSFWECMEILAYRGRFEDGKRRDYNPWVDISNMPSISAQDIEDNIGLPWHWPSISSNLFSKHPLSNIPKRNFELRQSVTALMCKHLPDVLSKICVDYLIIE